jgi:hypothetical protein
MRSRSDQFTSLDYVQGPMSKPLWSWFDVLTTLSKIEGRAMELSRFKVQCRNRSYLFDRTLNHHEALLIGQTVWQVVVGYE